MFVDKNGRFTLTTRIVIVLIGIITVTACFMVFTLKYQPAVDYKVNLLSDDKHELDTVWFYSNGVPAMYGDTINSAEHSMIQTRWNDTVTSNQVISMDICEMGVRVYIDGYLVSKIEVEDSEGEYIIADHETIYINLSDCLKMLKSTLPAGSLNDEHILSIRFNSSGNNDKIPTIFAQSELGALSGAVNKGFIDLIEFVILVMAGFIFLVLFLVYFLNKIDDAVGFLLLAIFCIVTAAYGLAGSNVVSILGWSSIRTTFAEYVALVFMMIPAVLYVNLTCVSYKKATLFASFVLFGVLNLELLLYGLNIASLTKLSWLTATAFVIQAVICMIALIRDWKIYRNERALTHLCSNLVLNVMLVYEMIHRVFLDENSKSHYFEAGLIAYIVVIACNTIKQNVTMSADNMSLQLYKKLSLEDSLTGLGSRAAYEIFLIEKGNSKLIDKEMSVLFVDINNLKQTNDILGHAAGDKLIKTVSGILQDVVRETHSDCYRIGGDEFVIIANIKSEAEEIPNTIRTRLEEHNKKNKVDYSVAIGLSSGVIGRKNPYGEGVCTMTELVQEADRRMYKDKNEYKERHKK